MSGLLSIGFCYISQAKKRLVLHTCNQKVKVTQPPPMEEQGLWGYNLRPITTEDIHL